MTINPKIPPEELAQWLHFQQHRDDATRNALVLRFMRIVEFQADKMRATVPDTVTKAELVSAGTFGLLDAINSYDLARGYLFATYCVLRIRGAIRDWMREMDWVPRLVRGRQNQLAAASDALTNELGRPPTDSELAELLDVTVAELPGWLDGAQPVGVLRLSNKRFDTDSHKEVADGDLIPDETAERPHREAQKLDLMRLVTKGLSQPERLVMLLYYYEELTMREIGETIGLSESRVSQMHSSIVRRLRERLEDRAAEFNV